MTDSTPLTRILYTTSRVHIYAIPPLTSNQGFKAGPWTAPPRPTAQQIFTARLRVLETSTSSTNASTPSLTVSINLEDPTSGELFASAPYTSPFSVQPASDSSRFFAVRVVGEGGMKATLGMGFEERGEAFDFGVALGEARKVLGWDGVGKRDGKGKAEEEEVGKRDFSLKEGERITISVGGRGRREGGEPSGKGGEDGKALFSIAPPPPPSSAAGKGQEGGFPSIAPPPSSSTSGVQGKTAQELGFDDGEFGEFQ